MNELAKDAAAIDVTDLLTRYSFDLGGSTVERLVNSWLHHYPTQWLRLAVIEALYQGRYKAISVEQILNLWQRRGRSLYRFNHEFERIVCGRFPSYSSHGRSAALNSVQAKPFRQPAVQSSGPSTPTPASTASPDVQPPKTEPSRSNPSSDAEPAETPSSEEAASSDLLVPSLSKGAPVPTFKPASPADLGILEVGVSRSPHREPIHQFTPTSESSDFYSKLRAVAQIEN